MTKSVVLNKKNEEIGNAYGIRTILVNQGENPLQRELEDGFYVVLQAHSGETKPVFAFQVDSGNFRITMINDPDDIANLAAQVWHLRFTNKQKTALKKLRRLKQDLTKIEKEIVTMIRRSESVKKLR